MSHRLVLGVIGVSVVCGLLIGYARGLPNDFVDPQSVPVTLTYGYRCADGTEFSIEPNGDFSQLRVVPATSADYVAVETLARRDAQTAVYQGASTTLAIEGSALVLAVAGHATTTCDSMRSAEDSLF